MVEKIRPRATRNRRLLSPLQRADAPELRRGRLSTLTGFVFGLEPVFFSDPDSKRQKPCVEIMSSDLCNRFLLVRAHDCSRINIFWYEILCIGVRFTKKFLRAAKRKQIHKTSWFGGDPNSTFIV